MECKICELRQRQFFCEKCLKVHLRDFRHQTQHFATDRDEQLVKSTKALESIQHLRVSRARVAGYQSRIDDISGGLAKLRKDNDRKRDRLRTLRETLASRRRTLSIAKLLPIASTCASSSLTIAREDQELGMLGVTIARARSGLVQELLEVFNVVEVGGRPQVGTKPGSRGQWTIGDLILPVSGDIRRYPPEHVNAVLTYTIHFISLLTFYLGIKLPFEIVWGVVSTSTGSSSALAKFTTESSKSPKPKSNSGFTKISSAGLGGFTKIGSLPSLALSGRLNDGKFGVGVPWIGAGRGTEVGGWAKWYTRHPLHVSSNNAPLIPPEHPSPIQQGMLESYMDDAPPPPPLPSTSTPSTSTPTPTPTTTTSNTTPPTTPSFTLAFTMLLYNIAYLAHTQGVTIPLSHAGDALANLYAVCTSPDLGKRSHAGSGGVVGRPSHSINVGPGAATPLPLPLPLPLPPPPHGATSAHTNTYLPPPTPTTFHLDFAQLLQATTTAPARGSARGSPRMSAREVLQRDRGRRGEGRVVPEKIVEEGWDLVDDDTFE